MKPCRKYTYRFDVEDADLYGKIANKTGYAYTTDTRKPIHRIILSRKLNREILDTEVCDHIDGDRTNNKRDNLRLVTTQQNLRNRPSVHNSQSRFKNVYKAKNKWKVCIRHNSKDYYFGVYPTESAAAQVANYHLLQLHQEYARLNTIN